MASSLSQTVSIARGELSGGPLPPNSIAIFQFIGDASDELASMIRALQGIMLKTASNVQEKVPVAMPSLQGVALDKNSLMKQVLTDEIRINLVHSLDSLKVSPEDPAVLDKLAEERDLSVLRLLNLMDMFENVFMDSDCPGAQGFGSLPCSGSGMCIGGKCVCYAMYAGADCSQHQTFEEVFDDGFRRGMELGLKSNVTASQQPQQIVTHATMGIGKCGDAVKETMKKLAGLNSHCHDVFEVSRLSPLEIMYRLELQQWVDGLRECAASSGASNNTAYRHLVPVLLIEGSTLRREVMDIYQMLKGLAVTAASKDCKIFDTVQYDLKISDVTCNNRANSISSINRDVLGATLSTKSFNGVLEDMLRVQGDPELKVTVDNMAEIVSQMLLLGPCASQCNKQGDCVLALCRCDTGFQGDSCSVEVPLAPGECARNCSNHGTCESGMCHCDFGWKGFDCSVSNMCENNCNDHGDCVDGVCECYRHWRGSDCSVVREICPDDYSCYQGVCVENFCNCFEGWTGDDCTIGDFFKDNRQTPEEEDMFLQLSERSKDVSSMNVASRISAVPSTVFSSVLSTAGGLAMLAGLVVVMGMFWNRVREEQSLNRRFQNSHLMNDVA